MKLLKTLLSFHFVLLLLSSSVNANPGLTVKINEGTKLFSLEELKSKFAPRKVTFESPVLQGKRVTYQGVSLIQLLDTMPGSEAIQELLFVCADGYTPSLSLSRAKELDLVVAYEEVGVKDWTKIQMGKEWASPAPFYVIGNTAKSYEAFPWPFQVVRIESVRFVEKYPFTFPKGAKSNENVTTGFHLYRDYCMACHSINLEGSTIGPELNIPKNITEYRSDAFLKAFIRNPDSYRANSRMSAFPQLTDNDLDNLIAYLKYMRELKHLDQINRKSH